MSANTYDTLPYTCLPRPDTHPNRLAAVATLFGLNPPPVETARILEIGCADGTHLAAIALSLPRARLLGIDYSACQIETGRQRLAPLGLENLELRQADIIEIGEEFGEFDYILCHGVYSWVSPVIQDKILNLCRDCLAPNGIAYISYNTRPGWNMRESLRDMLLFHTRHFPEIPDKLKQIKAWLRYAHDYAKQRDDSPYDRYLQEECARFAELNEDYLFHEFLEEHNHPLYFHQFIAEAGRHGLRYVGEAHFSSMFRDQYTPLIASHLGQLEMIHKEQYLDFLDNRQFRQTLLTHAETQADPALGLSPAVMQRFYFGAELRPLSAQPNLASDQAERFEAGRLGLSESHPIGKTALFCLGRAWPGSLSFAELRAQVSEILSECDEIELGRRLLSYSLGNIAEISLEAMRACRQVGESPTACPLARLMAGEGQKRVFNLRYEPVDLSDVLRRLLCLLDGQHDRAQLAGVLRGWIADGSLSLPKDKQGRPQAATSEVLAASLDGILRNLADNALLVA